MSVTYTTRRRFLTTLSMVGHVEPSPSQRGRRPKLRLSSEIKIQIWMADWPLHSLGRY
jgi:hypothetical protein